MTLAVTAKGVVRSEPERVSAALVVATLVTLAAVIPLGLIAWHARDDTPAVSEGVMVVSSTGADQLAERVLPLGTDAELQVVDPGLVAVAWSLYDGSDRLLDSGEVVGTSPFIIRLAGTSAVAELRAGAYDLLITATERDGTVVERAARFSVGDAP